jgi:hypothetical protein
MSFGNYESCLESEKDGLEGPNFNLSAVTKRPKNLLLDRAESTCLTYPILPPTPPIDVESN